jgi:hypothetical protein
MTRALLARLSCTRVAALVLPVLLIGCGSDSTGPEGLQFPPISATEMAQYCVRGNAAAPGSLNGSITTSDCNDGGDDGYWESWHIRTGSSGVMTFAVTSDFDSWLELLRLDNLDDITNSAVFLTLDDDGGLGSNPYDARLTYALQPNTSYAIIVSGFDDAEQGTYTLDMTGP